MKTKSLFLETYELINIDHKKFKKALEHKDLSYAEKKILKALLSFKKGKCSDAIHQLDSVTTQSNDYLSAYKSFIFGMIKNHQGQFDQASVYLVQSYFTFKSLYKFQDIHRPISVLAMMYYNLRDSKRLRKYYDEFKTIKDDSLEHNLLDYDYKIYIAILEKRHNDARNLIKNLRSCYEDKIQHQLNKYLIIQFTLAIQADDFDEAYEVTKKYGHNGGFKVKANFKFMMTSLNYYTKNSPLYVYQRDFSDNEFLFHQLKLIQALNLQNKDDAKTYWEKLQKVSPDTFKDNFQYLGDKNIFSLCLAKALNELTGSSKKDHEAIEIPEFKNNQDKLFYIINHSESFLSKDDLIQLIWNEQWSPKNDSRLRTLISRTQKKYGIKIENLDGKYKKAA
jgi:hypothetical protein